jgi:hypothetical protein
VLLANELLDGNQGRALPVLQGQDGLQGYTNKMVLLAAMRATLLLLAARCSRSNHTAPTEDEIYNIVHHSQPDTSVVEKPVSEPAATCFVPQQPGRQLVGEQA